MRVGARGGDAEVVLDGLLVDQNPKLNFSSFMFDPAIGVNGEVALATDYKGASQLGGDVIIRILQPDGRMLTPVLPDEAPYGHQDPAWNADGSGLYYVQNGQEEGVSASRIIYFDVAADRIVRFGAKGFIEPATSPDGRWVAATRIDKKGSDVVILSAATGEIVLEVTRTGRSWSPAWSPDGGSLIFLRHVRALRRCSRSPSAPHLQVFRQSLQACNFCATSLTRECGPHGARSVLKRAGA
jgi:hypothetical protein